METKKLAAIPRHKGLPYIYVAPPVRRERPEVPAHAASCDCRSCKKYAKLFRQLNRIQTQGGK